MKKMIERDAVLALLDKENSRNGLSRWLDNEVRLLKVTEVPDADIGSMHTTPREYLLDPELLKDWVKRKRAAHEENCKTYNRPQNGDMLDLLTDLEADFEKPTMRHATGGVARFAAFNEAIRTVQEHMEGHLASDKANPTHIDTVNAARNGQQEAFGWVINRLEQQRDEGPQQAAPKPEQTQKEYDELLQAALERRPFGGARDERTVSYVNGAQDLATLLFHLDMRTSQGFTDILLEEVSRQEAQVNNAIGKYNRVNGLVLDGARWVLNDIHDFLAKPVGKRGRTGCAVFDPPGATTALRPTSRVPSGPTVVWEGQVKIVSERAGDPDTNCHLKVMRLSVFRFAYYAVRLDGNGVEHLTELKGDDRVEAILCLAEKLLEAKHEAGQPKTR
jgi:hypothetical protein